MLRSFVQGYGLSDTETNTLFSSANIQSSINNIPDDEHVVMNRLDTRFGESMTRQYFNIAFQLGNALSSPAWLGRVAGACAIGVNDQQCRNLFYSSLDRLLASPMTPAELSAFEQVYSTTPGSINAKYGAVIGVALLDSRTLFRPWIGDAPVPSMGPEVFELDSFGKADKLAFTVTGRLPDAELMSLARNNGLSNPEVYAGQVRRLLDIESTRFSGFSRDFFTSYLWLDRKGESRFAFSADPILNTYIQQFYNDHTPPEIRWLTSLAMISNYVNYVLYKANNNRGGNVRTLLTSNKVFSQTPDLVELTGAQWNGDWNQIPESRTQRVGILGQPALQLLFTQSYDPRLIMRSVFIKHQLACQPATVPANTTLPPDPNPVPAMTFVEVIQRGTERPGTTCAGCHVPTNPFGIATAFFDPIGGLREEHRLVDPLSPAGGPAHFMSPVRANVSTRPRLIASDNVSLTGLRELSDYLAQGEHIDACIAKNLIAYRDRRMVDLMSADGCSAQRVYQALRGPSGSFRQAFYEWLTDSEFLRVRKINRGVQ